jgi:hypothetical protein
MGNVSATSIKAIESLRELGETDSTVLEFDRPIMLRSGLATTVELLVSFPDEAEGGSFGLRLDRDAGLLFDENVTVTYGSVQTGSMVAYIMSSSTEIAIDGAFADWEMRPRMVDALGDSVSSVVENLTSTNSDISIVKTASQAGTAFFYMAVDGSMLAGSNIPGDIMRWTAPDNVVGNITSDVAVPRMGTDLAFMFIDTDFNQSTGYYVGGSETCFVIVGKANRLISSTVYRYDGVVWVNNGPVDAAVDSYQLEVGSSFESLGISPEGTYVVTFLAQDWRGCSDDMLAFLSTRAVSGVREFGGIIINEVYSTNPVKALDWFELYNTSPDTIDLSGWELWVNDILVYEFDDGFTLDSGEIWASTPTLDFGKGITFELLDASGETIDSIVLPFWQARSFGRIGTPEDEYSEWDWMDSTPGEINIGQVPIPEFESVVMPLAIVTIMFFAIRRRRREQTTEENPEGETDGGHE